MGSANTCLHTWFGPCNKTPLTAECIRTSIPGPIQQSLHAIVLVNTLIHVPVYGLPLILYSTPHERTSGQNNSCRIRMVHTVVYSTYTASHLSRWSTTVSFSICPATASDSNKPQPMGCLERSQGLGPACQFVCYHGRQYIGAQTHIGDVQFESGLRAA